MFSLVLAVILTVFSNVGFAQQAPAGAPRVATIRSVKGTASFSLNGETHTLKPNISLAQGATITTGPDSEVYASVNGTLSSVRLGAEAEMDLKTVESQGKGLARETTTVLNLRQGMLMLQARRISAGSQYTVQTPHGFATVLGGDLSITVQQASNDDVGVEFTCITGSLEVTADASAGSAAKILHAGETWNPDGHFPARPGTAFHKAAQSGMAPKPPPLTPDEIKSLNRIGKSYNDFGFELLRATEKSQPKGNTFISPLSAAFALAMLQHGAAGVTQSEILKTLRISGLPEADIGRLNKRLADALLLMGDDVTIDVANSLWADSKAPLKPDFVAGAEKSYHAQVQNVALDTGAGVAAINDWASQHTHGKINSPIKKLGSTDALVLMNSIYFKAFWAFQFDPGETREKPFKPSSGKAISHPRMKKQGHFNYESELNYQTVALPYQGSCSMYVFLPKLSMASFLSSITSEKLEKSISKLTEQDGVVELPKFKLENSYDLVEPLKKMGMRQAFIPAGELYGISDKSHYVGDVKQDTYVDVNEEGTEAASITTVEVVSLGIGHAKPPKLFHMIVDHPFFIVIRDEMTKTILFMGIIRDPRGT